MPFLVPLAGREYTRGVAVPVPNNSSVPRRWGVKDAATGDGLPVPLGSVVVTRAVDGELMCHEGGRSFVMACLRRHQHGDWGALGAHDTASNHSALITGARILSSYPIPQHARRGAQNGSQIAARPDAVPPARTDDDRLWIITEAEDGSGVRSQTTVLYPSDY